MPRNYSSAAQTEMNATSGADPILILLEIDHVDLSVPIRVVNDTQDLVHQGNTFTAMAFRAVLPDDLEQGASRARLAIDNVGRDLMTWLESSGGGREATVRMIQVLRSAPDVVEWEVTMDLINVSADALEVSGELGFDNLLDRPAVALTYTPASQPGIF